MRQRDLINKGAKKRPENVFALLGNHVGLKGLSIRARDDDSSRHEWAKHDKRPWFSFSHLPSGSVGHSDSFHTICVAISSPRVKRNTRKGGKGISENKIG